MTNKNQDPESRLGHDPLEWLEEELSEEQEHDNTLENNGLSKDAPAQASAQSTTSTPEPAVVQEPSINEESIDQESPTTDSNTPQDSINRFVIENGIGRLALPERLMVQIAEDFHTDLCAIAKLEELQQIKLDASEVVDIDTAGLQLLYAFTKQLSSTGCQITIEAVPENLEDIFSIAGLTSYFKAFTHAA